MRRIVVLAVVLGLASGLLGAFAYGELFGSASAAPPATAVREQNLDGSGLIRVHEQGTADVNVTNGALPVTGTVDVGNLPVDAQGNLRVATQPTLTNTSVLFEGTINPGELIRTEFVDTAGCSEFTIFVLNGGQQDAQGTRRVQANLVLSADGSNGFGDFPAIAQYSQAGPGVQLNVASRFTSSVELLSAGTSGFFGATYLGAITPFAGAVLFVPSNLPARDVQVMLHCTG